MASIQIRLTPKLANSFTRVANFHGESVSARLRRLIAADIHQAKCRHPELERKELDGQHGMILDAIRAGNWTIADISTYCHCKRATVEFLLEDLLQRNKVIAVEQPSERGANKVLYRLK